MGVHAPASIKAHGTKAFSQSHKWMGRDGGCMSDERWRHQYSLHLKNSADREELPRLQERCPCWLLRNAAKKMVDTIWLRYCTTAWLLACSMIQFL